MQLAFAMLADFAEATPDGKLTIGGGDFDSVFAPSYPAVHARTVALVIRFILDPDEAGQLRTLRIEFVNPEGQPWMEPIETPFTPVRRLTTHETPPRFAFVFNFAALVLPLAGQYLFRLFLDQATEPISSLPLYAFVQETPASSAQPAPQKESTS